MHTDGEVVWWGGGVKGSFDLSADSKLEQGKGCCNHCSGGPENDHSGILNVSTYRVGKWEPGMPLSWSSAWLAQVVPWSLDPASGNLVWWCMPLGRKRQQEQKFKGMHSYLGYGKSAWVTQIPVSRQKTQIDKTTTERGSSYPQLLCNHRLFLKQRVDTTKQLAA